MLQSLVNGNCGKKFILSCSANRIVFTTWLAIISGVLVTSENVLGKFFWLWKSDISPASAAAASCRGGSGGEKRHDDDGGGV